MMSFPNNYDIVSSDVSDNLITKQVLIQLKTSLFFVLMLTESNFVIFISPYLVSPIRTNKSRAEFLRRFAEAIHEKISPSVVLGNWNVKYKGENIFNFSISYLEGFKIKREVLADIISRVFYQKINELF